MKEAQALDPWLDAQTVGRRLRKPGAELLVALGAESWCGKCQRLRPGFDRLVADMPPHVVPIWLDIEEHAEFLNGFVPPDLPLLLRWHAGLCIQAAVIQDINLDAPLREQVKLQSLRVEGEALFDSSEDQSSPLPLLWKEFTAATWAGDD